MQKGRRRPPSAAPSVPSSNKPNITANQNENSSNSDKEFLLTYTLLQKFPKMTVSKRHEFLLSLLQQCDPTDMSYLYKTLPTLHRDFLKLLPRDLSHRIVTYIAPKDLCTAASVSKSWREIVHEPDLWSRLYTEIGLSAMCGTYYSTGKRLGTNARRLHSARNWVRGNFKTRCLSSNSAMAKKGNVENDAGDASGGGILALAFDGRFVVTASADRVCRVWDVRNGEVLRTLVGHAGSVSCVQFDRSKIITGSADHTIRVWSFTTGEPATVFTAHTAAVTCLRYNNTILVTGSADRTVKIWQCPTTSSTSSVSRSYTSSFATTSTSPTRSTVTRSSRKHEPSHSMTSSMQSTFSAASSPPAPCQRILHGHTSGVKCIDFQGDLLVSGSVDGTIRIWHLSTGNVLRTIIPTPPTLVPPSSSSRIPNSSASAVSSTTTTAITGTTISDLENASSPFSDRVDPIACLNFTGSELVFGTLSGSIQMISVAPPPNPKLPANSSPSTTTKLSHLEVSSSNSTGGTCSFEDMSAWASRTDTFRLIHVYSLAAGQNRCDAGKDSVGCEEASSCVDTSPTVTSRKSTSLGTAKSGPQGRWALAVRMDRWRLISGGSEGRLVIWNHTTGKEVYALDEWTIEAKTKKKKQEVEGMEGEKEVETEMEKKEEDKEKEKEKEKEETENDYDGDVSNGSKERHGKAITGIAFDDSYIVAGATDGKLRIWDYTYQGSPK